MTPQTRSRLRTVLRISLGVLLMWAAVSKMARPIDFLASIVAYEFPLPRTFLKIVGMFLPWAELICGLLLIANFATETALVFVTFIFAIFIIATGSAWMRGLPISCGCFDINIFGIGKKFPGFVTFLESVQFAFFRNIALTAASVFLLKERIAEMRSVTVQSGGVVPAGSTTSAPVGAKQQKRAASVR